MSWNPVLDKFIEIKNEYIKVFGNITYDYIAGYTNESETCLERWIRELNSVNKSVKYKEYEDIVSCLELNQYENLLLFRYARYSNVYDGEVESSGEDFWDRQNGFYRECRSVVIDIKNDCLVLTPFKKFFNVNELEETSVENINKRIEKANYIEISDKIDGSMQSARWYNGRIVMAGSQAINPGNSWRLTDGYRMIKSNPDYEKMLKDYPYYSFTFEYVSLMDAHVVKYTKSQEGLYLIGLRNVLTGYECSYDTVIKIAKEYNIRTTRVFNKTFRQVLNELDDKSSDEAEGFVINIDGYKVKVKYNDYVYIHRALSKLSSINLIIRSIADDTYDDLISKLPVAYHDNVKKVVEIVVKYVKSTENEIQKYYDAAPKENQKQFMLYISQNVPRKYQAYCRAKYLNKPYNVLKSGNDQQPKYKKLKEMGVSDYSSIFSEVDENE